MLISPLVTSEDAEDMEAAAAPLTAFTIQRTRNLARKSQTKDHMSKTLHNRIMKKIRKECKDKVNVAR